MIKETAFRYGVESTLELCIAETKKCKSQDAALERMQELLDLVKDDKLARLREMFVAAQH